MIVSTHLYGVVFCEKKNYVFKTIKCNIMFNNILWNRLICIRIGRTDNLHDILFIILYVYISK